MGGFPQSFIEAVRDAGDIVRVISEYVPLKQAGTRMKGLCPFHQEKTPSFSVDPNAQLFYCFGCQTGGDLFKFVMLYENVDFTEAVKTLFAVAESYPDLKANENFLQLQGRISGLESEIADRREFFNDSVTNYNIRIESFPDFIVARIMKYGRKELFQVSAADRSTVRVGF